MRTAEKKRIGAKVLKYRQAIGMRDVNLDWHGRSGYYKDGDGIWVELAPPVTPLLDLVTSRQWDIIHRDRLRMERRQFDCVDSGIEPKWREYLKDFNLS